MVIEKCPRNRIVKKNKKQTEKRYLLEACKLITLYLLAMELYWSSTSII